MVGCYLVPRDAFTLERVVAVIDHQPRGTELLVAVHFNTDLEYPDENKHDKVIASLM